jgi:hypothetical protein
MPSVLVELISADMVESYRREAALDRKRGRGWSPAHTTPKSARVFCAILAPRRQPPVQPQERTFAPFRGWLCTLSMEAHRDDRDIGKLPPVGAALNRNRSRV